MSTHKQTIETGLSTSCSQIEIWHREPGLSEPDLQDEVDLESGEYELVAIMESDSLAEVYRWTGCEDGWLNPEVTLLPPYGWNYSWNAGEWFEAPLRCTEPGDVLVRDDGRAYLVLSEDDFRELPGFYSLPY